MHMSNETSNLPERGPVAPPVRRLAHALGELGRKYFEGAEHLGGLTGILEYDPAETEHRTDTPQAQDETALRIPALARLRGAALALAVRHKYGPSE